MSSLNACELLLLMNHINFMSNKSADICLMPPPPSMGNEWSAVATALVGGAFGYWLRSLEARRGYTAVRFDDLLEQVDELTSLSRKYWINDIEHGLPGKETREISYELLGRMHYLAMSVRQLSNAAPIDSYKGVASEFEKFWEVCTGGEFGQNTRNADAKRVNKIYHISGQLKINIRIASSEFLISKSENALIHFVRISLSFLDKKFRKWGFRVSQHPWAGDWFKNNFPKK